MAIRDSLNSSKSSFETDSLRIQRSLLDDIPSELSSNPTRDPKSALLSMGWSREADLYGICEGQGISNIVCLKELRELHSTYGELLGELLGEVSITLDNLTHSPETSGFFDDFGFNVSQWIDDPKSAPEEDILPLAPLSLPLIGLLSLSHFCITCKVLCKTPGEVRDAFKGFTGHSQGVIVAAAIARSTNWQSFYDNSRVAVEILFWIGFVCHNQIPFSSPPSKTVKECLDFGEGTPSPMLSTRGLHRNTMQKLLDEINRHLSKDEQLYISLVNTRNNLVIGGAPNSLHSLSVRLRGIKANEGLDQSKVNFNQRKPLIHHQFLPMSSPFHCPHAEKVTPFILQKIRTLSLRGEDFGIGVYHTRTGEDLRNYGKRNLIECLVRMVTTDLVDWPSVTKVGKNSVIVDFGPGRLRSLTQRSTEGTGVRVTVATELISSISSTNQPISKAGSFLASISTNSSPNWGEMFRPRLTTDSSGTNVLETRMTRLLGVPPVMVAGMTPTTVPWDFVSSIMRAGYHAEIAGGGYHSAKAFERAIVKLSQHIPPTSGITCNIIYSDPKAVQWQIPLIQDLVRRGYPIEGLTVGAGIPSAEVAKDYIETLGLKHVSFKPGSTDAIKQVIRIARTHANFPIGLQWTGGRGGGHHSFEDFHTPILETYSEIRQCSNIVLIAGSGFGGAEDTYPYLTGEWSTSMGYPCMPFDGVLLASRMMVAKEAHTSPQAKALIVEAAGVEDSGWHTSYTEPTGGIVTVKSEWGQPIHKLATRAVLLWSEFEQRFFGIADRSMRLAELQKNRSWIIERLNKDFQKPWFGVNTAGKPLDLEDMTYFEVIWRLVQLMYVQRQRRWIDVSYKAFVYDFATRSRERLEGNIPLDNSLECPNTFLTDFLKAYPHAVTELLHPEDVSYFMGLCGRRGRKPINFIPRLDNNFETWFKKDSLWQAEDIEAVPSRDAQRVCILQGPVAARFSKVVDEPVQTILDSISSSHIGALRKEDTFESMDGAPPDELKPIEAPGEIEKSLVVEDTVKRKTYQFPMHGGLPDADSFRENLLQDMLHDATGWASASVTEKYVRKNRLNCPNPIRSAIVPTHGHIISIEYEEDGQVAGLIMSEIGSSRAQPNEVLRVAKDKDDNINVTLSRNRESFPSKQAKLQLQFNYSSKITLSKLSENMFERNQNIKSFYAKLWLERGSSEVHVANIHHRFSGTPIILTEDMVQEFTRVVSPPGTTKSLRRPASAIAPLDISIVIAWEALVKPLLCRAFDCDLFQLLHRSNRFRYVASAEPLRIGDTLESSSRIQSITVQHGNKIVEVVAEIERNGVVIIEVLSKFFCKGTFTDLENTMSCIEEPGFEVFVKSEKESALLKSRRWVRIHCSPESLVGKRICFDTISQTTYDENGEHNGLHVSGNISLKKPGHTELIGTVDFECGGCRGNPVLDFLRRHGAQTRKTVPLQNSGLSGESTWRIKVPKTNKAYARVSKDTNPIHLSPVVAHYAELPDTVTHGMCTSAMISKSVEMSIADADPSRIRRYSTSFDGMVRPGDELKVQAEHVGMIDGRMLVRIQAFNDQTSAKVIEAEAEIEQAPTAYLFTGQGSQEKGMGMALYETSEAARALWDGADKYLLESYGVSILDIVRTDPKTLTVYFGGTKGRKIRDNYLAMTIERVAGDGEVIQEPIIKSLRLTSQSYTFSDPRGLLYSTQFAQPALVLMEMATYVDLESKGLIQEGASYAGHSLGEYSALGALAHVMSMESLISLVFYRGLTMQVAMERDAAGRTAFSMMAINPSRVRKTFEQDCLRAIINEISEATGTLLEIVNFNVHGRQYVCAGHLQALWTMTQVLNTIAATHITPDEASLAMLIREKAKAALELARPIELEQGTATTPLRGIDVPFHSTYLRKGIPAYRQYLETKILEENIDLKKLMAFIPNVTAKPFSTDKEYVEEVARVTESESLKELLDNVSSWFGYNSSDTMLIPPVVG